MSKIVLPTPLIAQIRPENNQHSWPFAPVMDLPGGSLRNHECGHIIATADFVLGVGLSPQHYIFVNRAPGTAGAVGSTARCG